jgi:hypothetical protein
MQEVSAKVQKVFFFFFFWKVCQKYVEEVSLISVFSLALALLIHNKQRKPQDD